MSIVECAGWPPRHDKIDITAKAIQRVKSVRVRGPLTHFVAQKRLTLNSHRVGQRLLGESEAFALEAEAHTYVTSLFRVAWQSRLR